MLLFFLLEICGYTKISLQFLAMKFSIFKIKLLLIAFSRSRFAIIKMLLLIVRCKWATNQTKNNIATTWLSPYTDIGVNRCLLLVGWKKLLYNTQGMAGCQHHQCGTIGGASVNSYPVSKQRQLFVKQLPNRIVNFCWHFFLWVSLSLSVYLSLSLSPSLTTFLFYISDFPISG